MIETTSLNDTRINKKESDVACDLASSCYICPVLFVTRVICRGSLTIIVKLTPYIFCGASRPLVQGLLSEYALTVSIFNVVVVFSFS
jgi:hypothetical protein